MSKKPRIKFHNVQLTADAAFRTAVEDWTERERIRNGRRRYPASILEDALKAIALSEGRDLSPDLGKLDLSVGSRGGAVRVPGSLWLKAGFIANRLIRSDDPPHPVEWTPRTAIIAAIYRYVRAH